MGLADLILGKTNPFAAFVDQNHNSIRGAGAQFAQGTSLGGALSGAAQGYAQGAPVDDAYAIQQKAEQERLDGIKQTAAWLKQNYPQFASLPPEQGFDIASKIAAQKASPGANDPANVAEYKFYANQALQSGQQPMSFEDWRAGSSRAVRAGVGQPIFGKNLKTGKIEPWQSMTDGTMVNTANKDANPSDYSFDPAITAQQRASGTAAGKIGGTTSAGLGIAAQNAENALATIDKLKTDTQGVEDTFGHYGPFGMIPSQYGYTVPGSKKADFTATLDQAKGQAFLQAYSTLRGAGAITDVEGQKAGQALARINDPNISKEAFMSALSDYEQVIRAGYQRLQEQAQKFGGDDPQSQPQISGGVTDMGNGVTIQEIP